MNNRLYRNRKKFKALEKNSHLEFSVSKLQALVRKFSKTVFLQWYSSKILLKLYIISLYFQNLSVAVSSSSKIFWWMNPNRAAFKRCSEIFNQNSKIMTMKESNSVKVAGCHSPTFPKKIFFTSNSELWDNFQISSQNQVYWNIQDGLSSNTFHKEKLF